jgi:hypothetical protein
VVKAEVDHRDVSVGNIIIVRHGYGKPATGMLIDWELSKYHEEKEARVYEKTVRIRPPLISQSFTLPSPRVLYNSLLPDFWKNTQGSERLLTIWNHSCSSTSGVQLATRQIP